MKFFTTTGSYVLFLKNIFSRLESRAVYFPKIIHEIKEIGMSSIGFVAFISIFVGAVVTLQVAYNMVNPLLPKYLIGLASRDSIILEFSPTMISLVLAGKIGSHIASSLGTMRVTEQIDALEVMGINTYNYLIFPKIIALLFYPFVITVSMFLGIIGGYVASIYGGFCTSADFIEGIQIDFTPFHVSYAFIKTFLFAFILASVPSYHGYFLKGGALEVGKASTTSFVWTSVVIIITNYVVTQLLLT